MTAIHSPVDQVRFTLNWRALAAIRKAGTVFGLPYSLTHSDAIIELDMHIIVLIASSIVLDREVRIMGADLSDIGVLAAAELWVVVTGDGVGWDRPRGG